MTLGQGFQFKKGILFQRFVIARGSFKATSKYIINQDVLQTIIKISSKFCKSITIQKLIDFWVNELCRVLSRIDGSKIVNYFRTDFLHTNFNH